MNLEHDSNSEDIDQYNDLLRKYNELLKNKSDSAKDSINYEKEYLTLLDKYNELIYAVERKFDNESRHQTALRYIREMEKTVNIPQTKSTPWIEPKFEQREWNITPIIREQTK